MNEFEEALTRYINRDDLKKIQSLEIGIIGAGGLGSNAAVNLVRSGFKSFIIADFDQLEASNLNRQFYFLKQIAKTKVEALKENLLLINPDLAIETISQKITKENIADIFKSCDIIIEACDEVTSKKVIVEEFMQGDKLLVSASGVAGHGNSDQVKIKKINDKFYLVGDFCSEVGDKYQPLAPKVNLVAAKQADIILNSVLEGDI